MHIQIIGFHTEDKEVQRYEGTIQACSQSGRRCDLTQQKNLCDHCDTMWINQRDSMLKSDYLQERKKIKNLKNLCIWIKNLLSVYIHLMLWILFKTLLTNQRSCNFMWEYLKLPNLNYYCFSQTRMIGNIGVEKSFFFKPKQNWDFIMLFLQKTESFLKQSTNSSSIAPISSFWKTVSREEFLCIKGTFYNGRK